MNLSVVMPFLNSDEIVRRTIKFWGRMDLPNDIEFIIVDDGSTPALTDSSFGLLDLIADLKLNLRIFETHEYRPWTSSAARNRAAKIAKGRNLFLVDGDYIISREALERARKFNGDRLGCRREFGVLTEDGTFTQDTDTLIEWGIPPSRIRKRKTRIPTHPNQFIMRRELFLAMGGYDEDRIFNATYPQREDNEFKRRTRQWEQEGKLVWSEEDRPTIYMYPNGQFCGDVDYNPFGLFHTLTRKTDRNYWYHHMRYKRDD
jgi:glycosyltransferase involved in cell wall biosynthesis